jgi:hypothetical protein
VRTDETRLRGEKTCLEVGIFGEESKSSDVAKHSRALPFRERRAALTDELLIPKSDFGKVEKEPREHLAILIVSNRSQLFNDPLRSRLVLLHAAFLQFNILVFGILRLGGDARVNTFCEANWCGGHFGEAGSFGLR